MFTLYVRSHLSSLASLQTWRLRRNRFLGGTNTGRVRRIKVISERMTWNLSFHQKDRYLLLLFVCWEYKSGVQSPQSYVTWRPILLAYGMVSINFKIRIWSLRYIKGSVIRQPNHRLHALLHQWVTQHPDVGHENAFPPAHPSTKIQIKVS